MPVNLSGEGGRDSEAEVAIAPDGTTTVVWYREAFPEGFIMAATRPAGAEEFGPPVNLSGDGGWDAFFPQIAVGRDGTTAVTWVRYDGIERLEVQAATRPAGETAFGAPVTLAREARFDSRPQVAVAGDGATTVVWRGTGGGIQAATRPAGAGAFKAVLDLSAAGEEAREPQLAVAEDGTTTVTWKRGDFPNSVIQAATRPAGEAEFGEPVDLSGANMISSDQQIGVARDGTTTVTWVRFGGSDEVVVQAATRPAGEAEFGEAVELSGRETDAYGPQIAVAPSGTATVAWFRSSGTDYAVQAATRPPGAAAFNEPRDLSPAELDSFEPQLAVSPDGAFTVTWYSYDVDNFSRVQAVSGSLEPGIELAVRAPRAVKAGRKFRLTVETSNATGGGAALAVATCAKLPGRFSVIRRSRGRVTGRTICWKRRAIPAGGKVSYRAELRTSGKKAGKVEIRGTASAESATGIKAGASGSRPVKVRRR